MGNSGSTANEDINTSKDLSRNIETLVRKFRDIDDKGDNAVKTVDLSLKTSTDGNTVDAITMGNNQVGGGKRVHLNARPRRARYNGTYKEKRSMPMRSRYNMQSGGGSCQSCPYCNGTGVVPAEMKRHGMVGGGVNSFSDVPVDTEMINRIAAEQKHSPQPVDLDMVGGGKDSTSSHSSMVNGSEEEHSGGDATPVEGVDSDDDSVDIDDTYHVAGISSDGLTNTSEIYGGDTIDDSLPVNPDYVNTEDSNIVPINARQYYSSESGLTVGGSTTAHMRNIQSRSILS